MKSKHLFISQTVLSDENLFLMQSPLWLAGFARLATRIFWTACGAQHYAQHGHGAQLPSR